MQRPARVANCFLPPYRVPSPAATITAQIGAPGRPGRTALSGAVGVPLRASMVAAPGALVAGALAVLRGGRR
ncbi:MAG TPA: hypothetical protein VKU92_01135 [Acidimicrobiales bacterium]|nr:hypothetical protein [Acidimicrobiales bacterium]